MFLSHVAILKSHRYVEPMNVTVSQEEKFRLNHNNRMHYVISKVPSRLGAPHIGDVLPPRNSSLRRGSLYDEILSFLGDAIGKFRIGNFIGKV